VILPDLNVLLYAYNPHVTQHQQAQRWWQSVIDGDELIGFPHEVLFGFVRIASNPRIGEAAVEVEAATAVVGTWLDLPHTRVLQADANHLERTFELLQAANGRGPLLSDAVLASYAIAHRACLFSNDDDFDRFPGLSWRNPLEE